MPVGGQFERALDLGSELVDFHLRARVLQVVERAAIGDGGKQGGQLQGCNGNALAKAGHHADAAVLGRLRRQNAGLLAGDLEASLFAQAQHLCVARDALEAKPRAQDVEVLVVGFGDGVGEVEGDVPGDENGGIAVDDVLAQRGQPRHQFDRRAGREAGLETQLLVDHGEDAPGSGVHYHHAAALRAKRRHGRPPDGEIVPIDVIAVRRIDGRRPLRQTLPGRYAGGLLSLRGGEAGVLEQTPQKQRDKEKLLHVRRRVTSASISDYPMPLWGMGEGGVN